MIVCSCNVLSDRDVRTAVFSAVETFGQVEVNKFGPASLITRNTNDVQQVQQVVFMGLTIMVSAPILIVGGVQLLALGAIGEYLGRAYLHMTAKPQYVIKSMKGFDRRPDQP